MPEFEPMYKEKSEIINDVYRHLIAMYLPPLIRMREWHLLFSINHDGVSMQTFYNNTHNRDNTVLLFMDDKDTIFGAYCCEQWHPSKYYYGLGESFVFTLKNEEDIEAF